MGPVDPHVLVLIDVVSDERFVVAAVLVIFQASIAKSDGLQDDDASARAKRTRDKTLDEEARLNTARDRVVAARAALEIYGVAVHGAPSQTTRILSKRRSRGP